MVRKAFVRARLSVTDDVPLIAGIISTLFLMTWTVYRLYAILLDVTCTVVANKKVTNTNTTTVLYKPF